MTQHHDAQLPDRDGDDVLDGVRAALARPGDLSDHDAAFYRRLVDAVDQVVQTRDRLRTAWTSARRRAARERALAEIRASVRDRMRAQLDRAVEDRDEYRADALRARAEVGGLRQALRALLGGGDRPDLADIPAADLVEPGDEVTTLAEMDGRMVAVEQRLDAIEERLSPPEMRGMRAPERPAPARVADTVGDVWVEDGDRYRLERAHGVLLPLAELEDRYGPLATMPAGGAE
ncbi:hypothetical protein [Nocardiopsis tropica]|uniref:hypothetical protein n=1 Tax=Nocardiopsis tropica TaxID=109330 RepID=UPI0031E178AA